ncbi:carbohydrate ABC transporter permease [Arthrobacter sp. YN]|uniref:carbohydrate ABC transporter permease n=1 Tax=Arthrobacter sp. YN TaxID=2020486 RepID=UPI000B5E379F|nr:carbohydrate ABC transporter permease [Arthrobacter sp. YN]ASN22072.1 ABC transporter permease [Arthrobacter sp. YN]
MSLLESKTEYRARKATKAKANSRPAWMGKPSPLFLVFRALVLVIACSAVLVPFVAVFMTSLAGQDEITASGGFVLWTSSPSFEAYQAVLAGGVVTRAMFVSIGVTVIGTLLSLLTTIALAYGLSRPGSLAHKPLLLATLFTLLFSPGIIPMYLIVQQLGLIDNLAALVLPVLINAFNVIIMRAFFLDIPAELIESARIDGAGDFRILVSIVLPMSKAAIAVVGLFYAVSYWNAFFSALLYLNSPDLWPMQLVLRTFVVNQTPMGTEDLSAGADALPPQLSIQMAILVLSMIPILVLYPFIQKHFAKGLMVGAVKG